MPTRELVGWFENHSHRPFKRVTVRARFASGEYGDAMAFNIAPGARERLYSPGEWKGGLLRHYITAIELANSK